VPEEKATFCRGSVAERDSANQSQIGPLGDRSEPPESAPDCSATAAHPSVGRGPRAAAGTLRHCGRGGENLGCFREIGHAGRDNRLFAFADRVPDAEDAFYEATGPWPEEDDDPEDYVSGRDDW
jgi:hypothetical protein